MCEREGISRAEEVKERTGSIGSFTKRSLLVEVVVGGGGRDGRRVGIRRVNAAGTGPSRFTPSHGRRRRQRAAVAGLSRRHLASEVEIEREREIERET